MEKEKIQYLLNQEEEFLLEQIGFDIIGKSARQNNKNEAKEKAVRLLDNQKKNFREVICTNEKVKYLLELDDSWDRKVELVTIVADLITTILIGIPPWNISVLLVRIGLDSLCQEKT